MPSRPTASPSGSLAPLFAFAIIMLVPCFFARAQQRPRTGPPIEQPPARHVPSINTMAVAPDQLTNRCPDTLKPAAQNAPSWTG